MNENSKLFPKIRFPEFKGAWTIDRLSNIFNPSREKGTDGLPTFSVTLDRGLVNRDELERKQETNLEAREHLLVRSGDIAYNMMRMWQGAFGRATNDGLTSPAYVVLRTKGDNDSRYFEYAFRKKRSIYLFWAYSHGLTSDRLRLYADDFCQIHFAAPSLPEQQKIADFLTAVDSRIGQLRQKKALLEDYKKGVMQQLFSQAIRFKDDYGSEYPDWEEKKLGIISEFLKGKGISKTELSDIGDIPCILYGQLYTEYTESISLVVSRTDLAIEKLVLSKRNDVIIPASGETHIDIATASCVTKSGIALGGDINIIRTEQNGLFLAYYLNSFCKLSIARVAQGSSVIHLYANQLRELVITFPILEEQNKIASFLSAIDRKIENVSKQIEETKTFKKGLLQQMFV